MAINGGWSDNENWIAYGTMYLGENFDIVLQFMVGSRDGNMLGQHTKAYRLAYDKEG